VRNAAREAVVTDLGLAEFEPTVTEHATTWETPQLTVTLVERAVGSLGVALEVDKDIGNARQRHRNAASQRIDTVMNTLGTAPDTTVALVELRGADAFPEPGTDPKTALRVGLAKSGRLAQFLTPEEKAGDSTYRAASSWSDLRRQVVGSLSPVGPTVSGIDLPEPVDTVAVYMLRRNATRRTWTDRYQVPVAVWTSSDDPVVWARTLESEWLPYDDLLRFLATEWALRMPECGPQW